jgi:hypothetical protein
MKPILSAVCVLSAAAGLTLMASAAPASAQTPVNGRIITVAAPEPKRFVLALDEIELEWTGAADAAAVAAREVVSVPRVRAIQREGLRATLTIDAGSEQDLSAVRRAAEDANPGAEGRLVLYEEGEPRSDRTRHLLTREVAILVDPSVDVDALTTELGVEARPVRGVPNAWVLLAKGPLDALRLAETAAGTAGVQLSYPLLRKKQELR